jgi:hypothetical protein
LIVPAGGLEKIATFVSLMGTGLNLVALVNPVAGASPMIEDLVARGVMEHERIIPISEFAPSKQAHLEDLFDETFYLHLLRQSGAASVSDVDLKAGPTVITRVEDASGAPFSRYKPAEYLLRNQEELLGRLSRDALGRFVALFERVNRLRPSKPEDEHVPAMSGS